MQSSQNAATPWILTLREINLSNCFFSPYRMQYAADYGVSLMLLLSVGFLPSGFITYLIRERKSEEKQVQLVSGVTKMTYWMATFIWDFMVNIEVSKNIVFQFQLIFTILT